MCHGIMCLGVYERMLLERPIQSNNDKDFVEVYAWVKTNVGSVCSPAKFWSKETLSHYCRYHDIRNARTAVRFVTKTPSFESLDQVVTHLAPNWRSDIYRQRTSDDLKKRGEIINWNTRKRQNTRCSTAFRRSDTNYYGLSEA